MSPVAFAEGTLRLAQSSDQTRARTLLKAATELFVYEERHTRTEIAIFEELARQLLRITPEDDRQAVATMLSDHPDAPISVLRDLVNDTIDVARIVLAHAPLLAEVDLLAAIATRSVEHLEAIARRPRLSATVVDALLRKLPAFSLQVLAENPSIRLSADAVDALVALAQDDKSLALALSRRVEDVEDAALTDLFLLLDGKGRRRVIQAIEILALRDFAAKRPMPRAPQPDPSLVTDLARMALTRDTASVARALAHLLQVDEDLTLRLIEDDGGEPLAVALKAIGLEPAVATRVLLFSGHSDARAYFELKRLVDLYESVSFRSAALLVGRWRGDVAPLPRRQIRHMPQVEAGTPVRRTDEASRRDVGTGTETALPATVSRSHG